MRILICGDVVGRAGRDAIINTLPSLKEELGINKVIVNAENAAHGFGLTVSICQDFYRVGVDMITLGNHSFDNPDILKSIGQDPRLIRPANYPAHMPGKGFSFIPLDNGKKIMVVNLMGQLFMPSCNDPFETIDHLLKQYPLGGAIAGIIVDMHAETTSEKQAMGYFCDGRVSAVVGTHTHVPTADYRVLPKGTAYQSDLGMCGDYDSIIGMKKDEPLYRFSHKRNQAKLEPAAGFGTLCALCIDIDLASGLATSVHPIRIGPHLHEAK